MTDFFRFSTVCFVLLICSGAVPISYAPAAEEQTPAAVPSPVKVRMGIYKDYERIVFDWPKPVTYSLTQTAGQVDLHFNSTAPIDLSPVTRQKLALVLSAGQEVVNDNTIIHLLLVPGKVARAFPAGTRLVVDIQSAGAVWRPIDAAALNDTNSPLLAAEDIDAPRKEEDASKAAAQPPAPAPEAMAVPAPVLAMPPSAAPGAEKPPEKTAQKPVVEKKAPPPEKSEDTGLGVRSIEDGAGQDTTVRDVGLAGGEVAKKYTAPDLGDMGEEPVPLVVLDPGLVTGLAIYKRANFVYLAFDRKLVVPLREMMRIPPRVQLEPIDAIGGTVYRFYLPQQVSLRASREGSSWQVMASGQFNTAPISLTIMPQPYYALGGRLIIPVEKPGETVRLYDPEVGDLLLMIPLSESGQAIRLPYRYADLQFVPTEQGVVIHPRTDGVMMRPLKNGIEITTGKGLRLSPQQDTGLVSMDNMGSARLFDFQTWYGPPDSTYTSMRQRWERALAEVPESERDRIRLDMSRFYFARNHAHEALGYLNRLARNVPDLERRAEFLALRGAVRVLANDNENGLKDLTTRDIANHPESKLWQAVARTRLRQWKEAKELFQASGAALQSYPETLLVPFSLDAIEASLATGDAVFAGDVLDRLAQKKPDIERASPAAQYLRGVLLSNAGHLDRAKELWERAAKGKDQLYRVRAELALTDLAVVKGELAPLKASERLERLRFAWRGDDLELDILRRLGKFYIEAGKVEEGLTALKQVLAFLPLNQEADLLKREMAQVFRDVFLGNLGSNTSPLESLSLYERFHELAPGGEEGEAIMRKLAARMVAVDLLDRAAGLLSDQVRNKLSGTLQARVGTQAAGIYLLDHKPEMALSILSDSEGPSLPDDLQKERTLLKARAFSDLERRDEASALLAGMKEESAERLRADIAWQARDWVNAAQQLDGLIGPPPEKGEKLSSEKSQLIINRAIALAMANDSADLEKLHQGFGEAMQASPQASLFKVLTEPEAGLPRDEEMMQSFRADVNLFQEHLENYRKVE